MPVDEPTKFVPSIAAKLHLRRDTELKAINILNSAKLKQGLTGKDPRGLAAAALYMACLSNDDRRIQKEVAMAAGTTEVTLRNRLRGLAQATGWMDQTTSAMPMPEPTPMLIRGARGRTMTRWRAPW